MFKLQDVGYFDKVGDVYILLVINECLLYKFGW